MRMSSTIKKRPRLVTAALFGALALGFGATSIAGDYGDVSHVVVTYSDLNPSSPAGAAALYTRIRVAADEVCQFYDDEYDPLYFQWSDTLQKACVHNAISRAVTSIGVSELSSIYIARNHGRH